MLEQTYERSPPNIEERYSAAVNASDLTLDERMRGAAPILVAAGLAARDQEIRDRARDPGKPSVRLGGALARLQSEWQSVEKPQRGSPKSIRQWVEELPLVKAGDRTVRSQVQPIMTRDKEGARRMHVEQRQRLDRLYEQELKFLAQKLPSRYWVRERLFLVAVHWGFDGPEQVVAEVLRYWLDDTCQTCHGTGQAVFGERVLTCPDCEGRKTAQVPGGLEGRRLFALMEESKHAWAQSLLATSRRIHAP